MLQATAIFKLTFCASTVHTFIKWHYTYIMEAAPETKLLSLLLFISRSEKQRQNKQHPIVLCRVFVTLQTLWGRDTEVPKNTGLFKMIVGVIHITLQIQPHVISLYGVTSRIRFMFLAFPQVSRKWRHESEPPVKPSPLTCYKHGTNSIIV